MATAAKLSIGPADHGRRMTLEEFEEAEEEEGYRYELARGLLEVTKMPRETPPGLIVYFFYRTLAGYDLGHPGIIYRHGAPASITWRLFVISKVRQGSLADRGGLRIAGDSLSHESPRKFSTEITDSIAISAYATRRIIATSC